MEKLSFREKQVEEMVVHGFCNKEIARKLDLSKRTVEDYRWRLMRKRGVHNVVQLVLSYYGIKQFGPEARKALEPAE